MITLAYADGIATISLDRAAARNALPTAAWRYLAATAAAVPIEARVVVIASAVPGIFCAGADLVDLARLAEDVSARTAFRTAMRDGVEAIAALPMPVIASVTGGCFGAGVALALAADLIVAAPDARFAIPPARLGIGYPAGDVARLVARIGRGQAARLLFTGAAIDAPEAQRIGLVELVGDADLIAHEIAGNDAAAVALLKRVIADPRSPTHAASFEASFGSAAFHAGTARYRR